MDVGHRRHDAALQGLDRQYVFDPHTHGMAGVPLGVGDHDLAGAVAKRAAQRVDLGCRAAPSGRGVGLVGDKHRVRGDLGTADAKALFCLSHQPVHDLADVVDIEPRAVECTVGDLAGHQLADAPHATLAHGVLGLDHDGCRAHADDHAVAAAIKGQGGLVQALLGGGCAGGEHARADPLHQVVAGHIIAGNDDNAPAAPSADPVLGDGHGVGCRRTRSVDVGVGAARANVLGKL